MDLELIKKKLSCSLECAKEVQDILSHGYELGIKEVYPKGFVGNDEWEGVDGKRLEEVSIKISKENGLVGTKPTINEVDEMLFYMYLEAHLRGLMSRHTKR